MEARSCAQALRALFATWLCSAIVIAVSTDSFGQRTARPQYTAGSENFIVFASSPQWATQVAQAAEKYRSELAMYWLGAELPPWPERCPLYVHSGPSMPASGETQYALNRGTAGSWSMSVQGTQERVLDSVLPHEITHTIFATHFGPLNKYMPRWADEGACTTVEHESEKSKHRTHLQRYLRTGRGLAFNHMFRLKEYPNDILPLYAQGHSAVQFLIDQGGPQKFVEFIGAGMQTENWPDALQQTYAYESIGHFQTQWNQWLADGSPEDKISYAPILQRQAGGIALASATGPAPTSLAAASTNPASAPASRLQLAASMPENRQATPGMVPVQAPADLASGQPVASSTPAAEVAQASGAVSWYQRRLTEVSGQQPPKYDGRPKAEGQVAASHSEAASPPTSLRSARPMQPQRPGVQVLDWGDSDPQPGMQSTPSNSSVARPPAMVPIYR